MANSDWSSGNHSSDSAPSLSPGSDRVRFVFPTTYRAPSSTKAYTFYSQTCSENHDWNATASNFELQTTGYLQPSRPSPSSWSSESVPLAYQGPSSSSQFNGDLEFDPTADAPALQIDTRETGLSLPFQSHSEETWGAYGLDSSGMSSNRHPVIVIDGQVQFGEPTHPSGELFAHTTSPMKFNDSNDIDAAVSVWQPHLSSEARSLFFQILAPAGSQPYPQQPYPPLPPEVIPPTAETSAEPRRRSSRKPQHHYKEIRSES